MLLIAAVWLIMIALIDPHGNFPLNDDWGYGRSVFDLLNTGRFHLIDFGSMSLFAQVLWGALFCKLFGASFTVLRISTLVLGLGGLFAAYGLLLEAGASRWTAFFGCLVLALNPFYLSLSYSFMTDVPFTAVSLMAIYAYAKALRHGSARTILLGTVLACAAALIRQIGVFIPIGFGVALLLKDGMRMKLLPKAILPAVVAAGSLVGYMLWLKSTGRLTSQMNVQLVSLGRFTASGPIEWIKTFLGTLQPMYIYLGLLLLPFTMFSMSRARWSRGALVASVVTGIAAMAATVCWSRWLPIDRVPGDYIRDFGLGPATLRDVWMDKLPNYPAMPGAFWIAVTAIAIIGGALLVGHLASAFRMAGRKPLLAMVLVIAVLDLATLVPLASFIYFDRYFLPVIPLVMLLVILAGASSVKPNRIYTAGSVLVLLLIGWFSIGGTHDYMAWNRLRWRAAGEAIRTEHISPQEIDAGLEFNVWNNFGQPDLTPGWWSAFDDYIVTFGPVPGYEQYRAYSFRRWMPPGTGHVCVLRRTSN